MSKCPRRFIYRLGLRTLLTSRFHRVAILCLVLSGCYTTADYNGDGTLEEGNFAANRYKLTLGGINLSAVGERSFVLRGLPEEKFTLGLDIRRLKESSDAITDSQPLQATVRMRIVNERNGLVLYEESPISTWVWSGALSEPDRSFVYLRGKSQETPLASGSVRVEAIDKLEDGGWGSYFSARRGGTYRVEVTVIHADPTASDYSVQVVGYGGERLVL
jgi:hypothetical protein